MKAVQILRLIGQNGCRLWILDSWSIIVGAQSTCTLSCFSVISAKKFRTQVLNNIAILALWEEICCVHTQSSCSNTDNLEQFIEIVAVYPVVF